MQVALGSMRPKAALKCVMEIEAPPWIRFSVTAPINGDSCADFKGWDMNRSKEFSQNTTTANSKSESQTDHSHDVLSFSEESSSGHNHGWISVVLFELN